MHHDLHTLKKIVISAAREELLPRFAQVTRRQKTDGSLITEADLACQQRIAEELQQHWPQTVFIGEEMPTEAQSERLKNARSLWCLDPLDGTSNFASGIPYYSVSLALIQDGRISLGIVYDPLRDECFAASQEQGVSLNGKPLPRIDSDLSLKQATAIIDFKRLEPALAARIVRDPPYASQRSFGSVALDWCWLAMGRGHVYLHGRSNIWDYAAGHFIFTRAGGHACTLEGEEIFVDELRPRSSVGATSAALFAEWKQWLEVRAK